MTSEFQHYEFQKNIVNCTAISQKHMILVQIPQQIFSRVVTSGTTGSWQEDQKVAVTSPLSAIFSTRMKMQSSASTSNFSRT